MKFHVHMRLEYLFADYGYISRMRLDSLTKRKGSRIQKEWPCQKCGWCCEYIPMDTNIINKNRHLFQRPVKKEVISPKFGGRITVVITDTEDRACVFLKYDNTCAIYNDRPEVCRNFGKSSGSMECPRVAPNGRVRSPEEVERAGLRVSEGNVERHEGFYEETGVSWESLYLEE